MGPPTRLVSGRGVKTPALSQTPMFVAREPPAKQPTTRQSAPVLVGTLAIPSSVAGGSRKRTCARLIPVDLEPTASQALTGQASIVQFAPALPAGGEILWSDAREVSASTTASALS